MAVGQKKGSDEGIHGEGEEHAGGVHWVGEEKGEGHV